jgi:hypothetical protein
MDDDRNCKVGVNNFPSDKKMGGQTAQGLYETTLREEFAKMNDLTRTNMYILLFWIQTRVEDKSLVDSLESTMVCDYDLTAYP